MRFINCTFKPSAILIFTICLGHVNVFGQTVSLQYKNIPLNEVLLDISDQFQTQISINAKLSAQCDITINQEFTNIQQALELFAKQCGLKLRNVNGVFVFQQIEQSLVKEEAPDISLKEIPKPMYLFQGQVVEHESGEPLPFVSIQFLGKGLTTDESGRFSFKSSNQKEKVKVGSLGYFTADTTFSNGEKLSIALKPRIFELDEIEVTGASEIATTHTGENAGQTSFNNIAHSFVPGISNNLIFNNLRLQPGIMAAGESIADYVIWGSHAGQNHVIYDGITLFNSWGINEDIGRVNPYIIKNVELYKGGYNVPYGDRISGVILIDGKRGHREKFEANVSVTNQLANAYLNIPLFKNTSSLQIAARKTYFELFGPNETFEDEEEIIVPSYDYTDFNLKFSTVFKNSDRLEISSINSFDAFEGEFQSGFDEEEEGVFVENLSISSKQFGHSINYTKNWRLGGLTSFLLSTSNYIPELSTFFLFFDEDEQVEELEKDIWENPILESSVKITHQFPVKKAHQWSVNGAFIHNATEFNSSFTEGIFDEEESELSRFSFQVQDKIAINKQISLAVGLKAEMPTNDFNVHLQPRINGNIKLHKKWNVNFGWGIYNQFIARNSVVDEIGNQYDIWQVTDNERIPVLESEHRVLGASYLSNLFELNIEGYSKTSNGISRYFVGLEGEEEVVLFQGDSRVIGLDVLLKKKWHAHEFWLAYTLAEVQERFEIDEQEFFYGLAPQSQRHEFKSVAVFNFNHLRLSLTHVYGTGFPNTTIEERQVDFNPYWRTDFAGQYLFELNDLQFQTGISILNLFDKENERLNQSVNVPNGAEINTLGIPFTPTVYLDCKF